MEDKPGWTDNSNGWVTDSIIFFETNIISLQFRILFASDYSITERGCAINRFCLKYHGTDCEKIRVEENMAPALKIFPNPASSVVHVEMQGQTDNTVEVSFSDLWERQIRFGKINYWPAAGKFRWKGWMRGFTS